MTAADPRDLQPSDSDLVGEWVIRDGHVERDAVCQRIQRLLEHRLEELAQHATEWTKLYRDPRDGRLWELSYPNFERHGGGPPRLHLLTASVAGARYGIGGG